MALSLAQVRRKRHPNSNPVRQHVYLSHFIEIECNKVYKIFVKEVVSDIDTVFKNNFDH